MVEMIGARVGWWRKGDPKDITEIDKRAEAEELKKSILTRRGLLFLSFEK